MRNLWNPFPLSLSSHFNSFVLSFLPAALANSVTYQPLIGKCPTRLPSAFFFKLKKWITWNWFILGRKMGYMFKNIQGYISDRWRNFQWRTGGKVKKKKRKKKNIARSEHKRQSIDRDGAFHSAGLFGVIKDDKLYQHGILTFLHRLGAPNT